MAIPSKVAHLGSPFRRAGTKLLLNFVTERAYFAQFFCIHGLVGEGLDPPFSISHRGRLGRVKTLPYELEAAVSTISKSR